LEGKGSTKKKRGGGGKKKEILKLSKISEGLPGIAGGCERVAFIDLSIKKTGHEDHQTSPGTGMDIPQEACEPYIKERQGGRGSQRREKRSNG